VLSYGVNDERQRPEHTKKIEMKVAVSTHTRVCFVFSLILFLLLRVEKERFEDDEEHMNIMSTQGVRPQ